MTLPMALAGLCIWASQALAQEAVLSPNSGFDCTTAASALGETDAEVQSCTELLPGIWRVVLSKQGIEGPTATVHAFGWHAGAIEEPGGPGHLARALARMDAHARTAFEPFAVQVLLEVTDGVPPGFSPHNVSGSFDGHTSSIRTQPFGITLFLPNWQLPPTAFVPVEGGPQTPPGSPSSPGVPMPSLARATLELDADYRGQWTVDVQRVPDGPFLTELVVPVAP